jgi:hypothetical protein
MSTSPFAVTLTVKVLPVVPAGETVVVDGLTVIELPAARTDIGSTSAPMARMAPRPRPASLVRVRFTVLLLTYLPLDS